MAEADKKDETAIVAEGPRHNERFEIRTPNRGFTGNRCNGKVVFRDGVGFTNDEDAARACSGFGYEVIDHKRKK